MDNKTYLTQSAKTDAHGNYNFSEATRVRLINALRRYLTSMQELDAIKRDIFYVNNTPEDLVSTPRGYTHGILGIATESQELCETFLDHLENGTPLDEVNLREECGDVLWYVACVLREAGTDFGASMNGNIAKLKERFPDKFDSNKARGKRNKKAEMEAMQKAEAAAKVQAAKNSDNSSSQASGRGELG